ncbi:General secretion pathway protein K [Candidatus Methylobacter favarea]|uniref:Type II secretion system protein K n=1 Tax=Candidatus Methylobacter favarea TaxID=2707345 RepID=A0A8S0YAL5_9GAMM|nr:type II secretion system protein GspK [Candidatus Methylobacter favarea]CAA9892167.1 General secretion pathway protein K [Candidatus Methylobacter favarea]
MKASDSLVCKSLNPMIILRQLPATQNGLALVLVLWIVSLLTIMAGSFALSMRRESSIITGIVSNAQAKSIAESGLAIAEMMLLNPEPNKRWRTDGSVYEMDFGNAKVRLRLLSESGKIDINIADQALLQSLMNHAPVEDDEQKNKLVNAILDWRDKDDLVHLDGAEKAEYQKAGLSYQPRNKPFQSIEELQMVLGMDENIFLWIEDLVTVYSGQPVDLQLASRNVLEVLPGLEPGVVENFLAARRESALSGLPTPGFPSGSAQNTVSGQNAIVSVQSEARLSDGSKTMINTVIKNSDNPQFGPFQILKWQVGYTNTLSLFTDEMLDLLVMQYAEPEFNN